MLRSEDTWRVARLGGKLLISVLTDPGRLSISAGSGGPVVIFSSLGQNWVTTGH